MLARHTTFGGLFSLLLATAFARAETIPEGYEVGERTVSPDGRFAILYPLREPVSPSGEYRPNLLVRLEPYAVVTKVGSMGLPQNVTTALGAEWSGNTLVAVYESRKWGLLHLWVYELDGDRVKRVHPVGEQARKIFDKDHRARLHKKYPKESGYFAFVDDGSREGKEPDFSFKGRKLHLHLVADNKPNGAAGPHWTAELRAIWNLDTAKFERLDFRPDPIVIREAQ
jgi:hypothetical protein